jgi:hypothetical protein
MMRHAPRARSAERAMAERDVLRGGLSFAVFR